MDEKYKLQFICRFLKALPNNIYQKTKNKINIKKIINEKLFIATNEYELIVKLLFAINIWPHIKINVSDMENVYIKIKYNMTKKDMLTQFLMENDVYHMFMENHNKYKFIPETFENYINRTNMHSIILNAFHWKNTPQGHWFWKNLHDKYIKHINNYINYKNKNTI